MGNHGFGGRKVLVGNWLDIDEIKQAEAFPEDATTQYFCTKWFVCKCLWHIVLPHPLTGRLCVIGCQAANFNGQEATGFPRLSTYPAWNDLSPLVCPSLIPADPSFSGHPTPQRFPPQALPCCLSCSLSRVNYCHVFVQPFSSFFHYHFHHSSLWGNMSGFMFSSWKIWRSEVGGWFDQLFRMVYGSEMNPRATMMESIENPGETGSSC